MKKIIALLLMILMVCSLAACAGNDKDADLDYHDDKSRSTFVESYNFSGKTIVPFCTSGGSGVGSSAKNLEKLTSGATWLSGMRLNGNASHSSIVEWINGLELEVTVE